MNDSRRAGVPSRSDRVVIASIIASMALLSLMPSVAAAERLRPQPQEQLPEFSAASLDAPPITLGLSSGKLLYVAPRVMDNRLEICPVKDGTLVTAVLDADPSSWTDAELAQEVIRLLHDSPGQVRVTTMRSNKPASIAVPKRGRTAAYLTCLSLDRPSTGPLKTHEAIRLLEQDLSSGAMDILGPIAIDLTSRIVGGAAPGASR